MKTAGLVVVTVSVIGAVVVVLALDRPKPYPSNSAGGVIGIDPVVAPIATVNTIAMQVELVTIELGVKLRTKEPYSPSKT